MMKGFKEFMLRGNVVELAVAVVMGAAFTAVVTAFVKDLLTPLIAAIVGAPDFSAISVSINGSKMMIGDFMNALVAFLMVGVAVYFFVVMPRDAARSAPRPWFRLAARPETVPSPRTQTQRRQNSQSNVRTLRLARILRSPELFVVANGVAADPGAKGDVSDLQIRSAHPVTVRAARCLISQRPPM